MTMRSSDIQINVRVEKFVRGYHMMNDDTKRLPLILSNTEQQSSAKTFVTDRAALVSGIM
jgi:hypothetical protein